MGATVIFNVDSRDAGLLKKDLRGQVGVADLIVQEVGEAVARIGTEVVRWEAFPPLAVPREHQREEIIERSRRQYCR